MKNWYRNHSGQVDIETVTYYETRDVFGFRIVNESSMSPETGRNPVGLDEDHLSIAKPRKRDAQVCDAARDLLRNHVLAAREGKALAEPRLSATRGSVGVSHSSSTTQGIVVKVDVTTAERSADSPPLQLPPAALLEFVGRRGELMQLTDHLRNGRNVAVVGPGGNGKTALAAEALREVVGRRGERLAGSPFPDGIVLLNLYLTKAVPDPIWNELARKLGGEDFLTDRPARERAERTCDGRRALVIVEGAELADGQDGRTPLGELLAVLHGDNRRLVLTRDHSQSLPVTVKLLERLPESEAAELFDKLLVTAGGISAAAFPPELRARTLKLLAGHPLAITWAAGLLGRGDEDALPLIADWEADPLLRLVDPQDNRPESDERARHTLRWLFDRSVCGLSELEQQVLLAAGLLAHAPFPIEAIEAAVNGRDTLIVYFDMLGDRYGGEKSIRNVFEKLLPSPRFPIEHVRDAIKRLVQRGLLRVVDRCDNRTAENRSGLREFLHVFTYQFARSLVAQTADPSSTAGLRRGLASWLHQELMAAQPDHEASISELQNLLSHTVALLYAHGNGRLGLELVKLLLDAFRDRLINLSQREDWDADFIAICTEIEQIQSDNSAES